MTTALRTRYSDHDVEAALVRWLYRNERFPNHPSWHEVDRTAMTVSFGATGWESVLAYRVWGNGFRFAAQDGAE